ncbi:MAG: DUF21 domain-containing protein [Gammaproteobacteria bacterium]
MHDLLTWAAIAACLSQSATFSGLNLAFFSLSRLRLEVEVAGGNAAAKRVLEMRGDANLLLTTILWGNVGVNVLLTLLTGSVLAGASAFVFSTVFITAIGEILPQAYCSRNALTVAARLAPLLRAYQLLLYPVVKPSAMLLDAWLGREGLTLYRERDLKELLRQHMLAVDSDIGRTEAIGAMNFLTVDDLPLATEGVALDPASVMSLPIVDGVPVFPPCGEGTEDPFLLRVDASGKPWVVITDDAGDPVTVLDADGYLRHAAYRAEKTDPRAFCHRPIVFRNPGTPLGEAIRRLAFDPVNDDVISRDIILLWHGERRLVTGSDLLGRLLRGVARTPF